MTISPSSEFATALLLALIGRGMRDVIVCPGSRSQALALAAAELERAGLIRLHVRIDERSAAFLALGLSKASDFPAAIIVTSGSAVANLLPAVVEASRASEPLLLLTADRPHWLRKTGASQTTNQVDIFTPFTQIFFDDDTATTTIDPYSRAHDLASAVSLTGVTQINLQFVEPLSGTHNSIEEIRERIPPLSPAHSQASQLDPSPIEATLNPADTVILAGFGAHRLPLPHHPQAVTIAEITSRWRHYHTAPEDYRSFLASGAGGRRTLLALGMPNLSREALAFASREDVHLYTLAQPSDQEIFNPKGKATRVSTIAWDTDTHTCDHDVASKATSTLFHAETPTNPSATPAKTTTPVAPTKASSFSPLTREQIAQALFSPPLPTRDTSQSKPEAHDAIYLAASALVRTVDKCVGTTNIPVYSHRGLSGIDGTISLASGVALARQARNPEAITRLLIGDLAFLHDMGGLSRPASEAAPPLQIFLVNDGGGHIFAGLEVAQADPALYRRVVQTPTPFHAQAIASSFNWAYTRISSLVELENALASRLSGIYEICL